MTEPQEVSVIDRDYWARNPEQLAQLLTSQMPTIPDVSGRPAAPDEVAVFTLPAVWAQSVVELRDAARSLLNTLADHPTLNKSRRAARARAVRSPARCNKSDRTQHHSTRQCRKRTFQRTC